MIALLLAVILTSRPEVIAINGLDNSYHVDKFGTKIYVPVSVRIFNFEPVVVEIKRDDTPWLRMPEPPYDFLFCVNCFRKHEALPRSVIVEAKAINAQGKAIRTLWMIKVTQ